MKVFYSIKKTDMEKISKKQFITDIGDYENFSSLNNFKNRVCLILFWKNDYQKNDLLFQVAEQLEDTFFNKVDFYSVNVEQEAILAADLGIRKIPTWLFLPIQKNAFMIQGVPPTEEMIEIIKSLLNG